MFQAARVALTGLLLTGVGAGVGAGCTSVSHPPVAAKVSRAPSAASTTSTSTSTATTTTTVAPDDGFRPVVPGSALVRLVTGLGTVLRVDPHTLQMALVPGTKEPGGVFPEGGQVPLTARPALVAATNAGFKRVDARGGELVDGRTTGMLVPGAASFVVRADGTFDVGAWQAPGEVFAAPGDQVVLQNLLPLVDHGRPAPDLGTDILGRWGLTYRPQVPVSVWRSGLGIDSRGRLLYGAGPNLVPAQLAQLLLSGGTVRAMQLDINHMWVFAAVFVHPDPSHPESVQGEALLSGMTPTPNHVLAPGARDFLAIYQRAAR